MAEVASASLKAARDLLRGDILRQALWPPLASLVLWSAVAIAVWNPASVWLTARLPDWSRVDWLGAWLAHVALFLAFAPLIYFTTLLLVAAFALPRMMAVVAARDYPDVSRQNSAAAALWGSLGNTLVAGLIFVVGWLLTLPLLFVPGVILVLPIFWTAWLNQRSFRFDALAEHATAEERKMLVGRTRSGFWLAGLVSALAANVPVVNLLAPAFSALLFVHLGLQALRRLRTERGVVVS